MTRARPAALAYTPPTTTQAPSGRTARCAAGRPPGTAAVPMTDTIVTGRTTRAERMSQPHLREVITAVAEEHGACIRPLQFRKTNLDTGQVEQVLIPCGATLASVCPSCAERAKTLRA